MKTSRQNFTPNLKQIFSFLFHCARSRTKGPKTKNRRTRLVNKHIELVRLRNIYQQSKAMSHLDFTVQHFVCLFLNSNVEANQKIEANFGLLTEIITYFHGLMNPKRAKTQNFDPAIAIMESGTKVPF